MSHEDAKIKHSKRIQNKESAIKKQVKIAKEHGFKIDEPHRFNKHHALDCGIPNCPVCMNPRRVKHANNLTKQEKGFFQDKLHEE